MYFRRRAKCRACEKWHCGRDDVHVWLLISRWKMEFDVDRRGWAESGLQSGEHCDAWKITLNRWTYVTSFVDSESNRDLEIFSVLILSSRVFTFVFFQFRDEVVVTPRSSSSCTSKRITSARILYASGATSVAQMSGRESLLLTWKITQQRKHQQIENFSACCIITIPIRAWLLCDRRWSSHSEALYSHVVVLSDTAQRFLSVPHCTTIISTMRNVVSVQDRRTRRP